MSIKLKPHNEEAYRKLKEKFQTSNKVAVIHPTGTGKMYIALKMLEDNREKKAIYIAPSNTILHDVKKNIFAEKMNMSDFPNLKRITYQKLARLSDQEIQNLDFDIIILDEFHHCGAPEWSKGVERLIQKNPNANILGLSATPLRYLDGLRDMSDELFDNNVASEMTLEEAIEQEILPKATYVSTLYGYDAELESMQENINKIKDKEKREQAQKLFDSLRKKLDKNTRNLPELFAEYMKNKSGKYIVFCRNIEDMQEKMEQARSMFGAVNANITIRGVSSKIKESDQVLTEFENDNDENSLKLLYAVDMLNEGYHIKDLDGVIMMRPTLSPTIFTQQLGRALTVGGNKVPVILDLVNNFSTCKIIEDFTERMKKYKGNTGTSLPNEKTKSRISIFDKTKEFMEIANKITKLSKRNQISLEEKIQIFEKFSKTGEKLTGDTIFEGYPVGLWAIQIRSSIKRQNAGKNQRVDINPTEEQLDRLYTLGILNRLIEPTIDEKIEMLVNWMKKYPKVEIKPRITKDVLRDYATTEEEYLSLTEQYQNMQRYYDDIRGAKNRGKLTEEQISKCKEGNVRGFFGYPTLVEELAKKTGQSEKNINYIITKYGSMDNFVNSYRRQELNEDDLSLASSMLRKVIDVDLSPKSEGFDNLYSDICEMYTQEGYKPLQLYHSERLQEALAKLTPKRKYVIERLYGLLSNDLPTDIRSIAKELGNSNQYIASIKKSTLFAMSRPSATIRPVYLPKTDDLTDDEKKVVESLFTSDIVYKHNLESSVQSKKIKQTMEIVKGLREAVEQRRLENYNKKLNTPLEDTNIPIKAYNYLKNLGINCIGDLRSSKINFLLLRDLGKETYRCYLEAINECGAYELSPEILEMTEEEINDKIRQLEQEERMRAEREDTILNLNLSARAYNVLCLRNNIHTVSELAKLTKSQIISIRRLWKKGF